MSMEKEKLTALKVIPENIPEELKNLKHWTLWKYHKKEDGTYDKPNFQTNGKYARVDDPETWSTFEAVMATLNESNNYNGIGFVISAITEDSHIIGIDVDHAGINGNWKPEILEDLSKLNTYVEISPSGEGLRAFVKGYLSRDNAKVGNFEIYRTNKFLSVTGNILGTQKTIGKSVGELHRLYDKWFPKKSESEIKPSLKPSPKMSNEEILGHLKKADNSEKFFVLYSAGNWGKYYPSHSEGDAGLCSLIAFYTQDTDQIDQIFRTSALYRPEKWGDREDYRKMTFDWVFSHLSTTYQPQPEKKKSTKKKDPEDKETKIPEQIQQLIEEVKQCEEKGLEACKAWIKENALQLTCTDRKVWEMKSDYNHDLGEFVESYPQAMNDVKNAFELEEFDTATIHSILNDYNALYSSEKSRHEGIKNRLDKYSDEVIDKAVNELQHGDSYLFVYNAWKKQHVGDEPLGKSLAVCAASTLVSGNNDGLHFKPSGESGKGKTSGIDAFLSLLPPSMVIRGGISDKFVYYAGNSIKDGSIIFMDDRPLSENLKGVVKNSISNFQNPEPHRTVLDGKAITFKPAKRMIWIFASVDGFDDEQLSNRFLMTDVDSSEEQDTAVARHQGNQEIQRLLGNYSFETDVCQCIFSLLSLKTHDIVVPFQQEIAAQWNHKKNRRNQPKFRDIIKAVCIYKIFQRQHIKDVTIATFNDFLRALTIYGSTAKQNNTNLTADEEAIIKYLLNKNLEDYDFRKAETLEEKRQYAYKAGLHEIAEALGKKDNQVRRILLGRAETHSPGLDSKVQHFHYEKDETKPNKVVFFYSGEHDFEQYTAFCGNVSPEKVEEQTAEFIAKYQSITKSTQKIEDKIKNQALQEAIQSLPSQCIQLFQTFPDFSRGMEKLENDNGSNKNIANIGDFSNFSRTERDIGVFCDLDCKELGSEQSNSLQSTVENRENLGLKMAISGKVTQTRTENKPNDNDFQLFQGLEKSGKVWKSQATDSGKLKLRDISCLNFQAFNPHYYVENPILNAVNVAVALKMQFKRMDDFTQALDQWSSGPEMEELIAQHAAKEAYSQKQDFVITPEDHQLHEENLHQISLIPDPTELDRFYLHVEGIDIQEIPTEEEEKRFAGFKSDCLELEKVGKLNPLNRANEMQELFNIWDHAIHACESYGGKLTLNEILDRRFKDLQHRWLGCFFIERAMERGEVQLCTSSA